jgi:hypothetical protein
MTLLWVLVTPIVILMDIVAIVDVVRRRLGTGATIGWIILILILPIIGPAIYVIARKPSGGEVEEAYLAEADRRAHRAQERI